MKIEPVSWAGVGLTDLFFAFRKAKADCFFETSVRVAEKFVDYERNIGTNLASLLVRLQAGEIDAVLMEGLGAPTIFPKKVTLEKKDPTIAAHAYFSDAKRAFSNDKQRGLVPEFRMIGDFDVEVHVISALWVNIVGHKIDAQLGNGAVASRLRRYRHDSSGKSLGEYHLEAIGSFEPYFEPYRKWRNSGLDAIKGALTDGQDVVALTLDVGNFYHQIDPKFAVNPEFYTYLGISLSQFEMDFTKSIILALSHWSDECAKKVSSLGCESGAFGGLPIGLSVVRVLSNAILVYLDREVEKSGLAVYYARYVDDVFLVLKDHGAFECQKDVWDMLSSYLPFKLEDENLRIEIMLPPWAETTQLYFQSEKQKCFFLSGTTGLDLLDNIGAQIREVSSERRLMPLPEHLDQTQSARALTASDSSDEADSLRRADGLTLRRLGWSILLRSVEVLARDLHSKDWIKEREKFYEFAHGHVIRPDKILEQIDRLPRLFSIAVSLSDWKHALSIWRGTISSTYELQKATEFSTMRVNGHTCKHTPPQVWDDTRTQIRRFFREALFRALPIELGEPKARAYFSLLRDLDFISSDLFPLALDARETDWARLPYKRHIRDCAERHAPLRAGEELLYGRYAYEKELRTFLEHSVSSAKIQTCWRLRDTLRAQPYESLLPFLLPTRAYTPEEIALFLPSECVEDEPITAANAWAEYTRALRGVWVRSNLAEEMTNNLNASLSSGSVRSDSGSSEKDSSHDRKLRPKKIIIDDRERNFPVRIGITSFGTSDATWALAASGRPDLSPKRYKAIADIVNQALKADQRPDYLVFPELSVPAHWLGTISSCLREGRISLIAGLDYDLYNGDGIDSSAAVVLDDHRLGYSTSLQLRQRKAQPAPSEEKNLLQSHGRRWSFPRTDKKPVYVHRDFHFSILVCSELQNIAYRSEFQGEVDCLFVLSWNKDLETFSALVDSASLDVHAYIALANNLRYGDSRVRSPARESFRRDVCRVRGGVNNQLVVVEIDPRSLRAQQSRAKRWPETTDEYKPAPEGFEISRIRRRTPS